MLILTFRVGSEAFALDTQQVVEVTPWVHLRPIPHAPAYVVGLCQFRGDVVPVIDLARLLGPVLSEPRLNTRIIIVRLLTDEGGQRLLGLLAERVQDVKNVPDSA